MGQPNEIQQILERRLGESIAREMLKAERIKQLEEEAMELRRILGIIQFYRKKRVPLGEQIYLDIKQALKEAGKL